MYIMLVHVSKWLISHDAHSNLYSSRLPFAEMVNYYCVIIFLQICNYMYLPSLPMHTFRVLVKRTRHVTPVGRLLLTALVTMVTSTWSFLSSMLATSGAPLSFSRISAKSAKLSKLIMECLCSVSYRGSEGWGFPTPIAQLFPFKLCWLDCTSYPKWH